MRSSLVRSFFVVAAAALSFRGAEAQWTPNGTPISTAANDQDQTSLCSDGTGGAIIVWSDSRSGPYLYDIYAQRVNAVGIGQWAANGVPVCTAAGDQILPLVVPDGAGGAIVAWRDSRNGNTDIFAQRLNASGAPVWAANGVALCNDPNPQGGFAMAPDGSGGAYVVWEDFRGISGDIYGQRVNAAGVPRWVANGRALCAADEEQFLPVLVQSNNTSAILTWFDDRNFDLDVFALKIDTTGASLWTANGVAVCLASGSQTNPTLISDGAGGAIVAWEDFRDTLFSFDIYAQRLNSSGVRQWTVDGVSLVANDADQLGPSIASDGAGGAIVAWEDLRNATEDIFARRISSAGVPQWAADGIPVCTSIGTQQPPDVTSDGAGGAIVVWEDMRSSLFNTDLYAQRLAPNGSILWASNGLQLTASPYDQVNPAVMSDGAGGAILAWEDGRGGLGSDIYGQRVSSGGVVAPTDDVADAAGAPFRLTGIEPNPCRGHATFHFAMASHGTVSAEIFDLEGRRVRQIATGADLAAGAHTLAWDARNDDGAQVSGGLYWLRLATHEGTAAAKITVLH